MMGLPVSPFPQLCFFTAQVNAVSFSPGDRHEGGGTFPRLFTALLIAPRSRPDGQDFVHSHRARSKMSS